MTSNKTKPKSTFSEAVIRKDDVGEFQAGYFIMPSNPAKPPTLPNVARPSPSKRKQHASSSHTPKKCDSPSKKEDRRENFKERSPCKADSEPAKGNIHFLLTPSNIKKSSTIPIPLKSSNSVQDFILNQCASPVDDDCSDSKRSGRWAGPAFGNSPSPSSLPLPNFPPFSSSYGSPPSSLKLNELALKPWKDVADWDYQSWSCSDHVKGVCELSSSPDPPNLADLSFELRRLLNIRSEVPPIAL